MFHVVKYLIKPGVSVCTIHKRILTQKLHNMKVVWETDTDSTHEKGSKAMKRDILSQRGSMLWTTWAQFWNLPPPKFWETRFGSAWETKQTEASPINVHTQTPACKLVGALVLEIFPGQMGKAPLYGTLPESYKSILAPSKLPWYRWGGTLTSQGQFQPRWLWQPQSVSLGHSLAVFCHMNPSHK